MDTFRKNVYHKKGVSDVIAVVLLLAITVILAAMLSVFVFNLVKPPVSNQAAVFFSTPNPPTESYPNQGGFWEFVPIIGFSNKVTLGEIGFSIENSEFVSIVNVYQKEGITIYIAVDVFNGSNTYGQYGNATGGYGHPGYFSISWYSPPAGTWKYYTPEGSPSTPLQAGGMLGIHVYLSTGEPPITVLQGYTLFVYSTTDIAISGQVALV
jgi:flagellin-like protein